MIQNLRVCSLRLIGTALNLLKQQRELLALAP